MINKGARNVENKYRWYKCGRCGFNVYYLPGEERPNICPDCNWSHHEMRQDDVPSEVWITPK